MSPYCPLLTAKGTPIKPAPKEFYWTERSLFIKSQYLEEKLVKCQSRTQTVIRVLVSQFCLKRKEITKIYINICIKNSVFKQCILVNKDKISLHPSLVKLSDRNQKS